MNLVDIGKRIFYTPNSGCYKSQVLADFVVDWIGPITQPDPSAEKVWTIHCDGAWCHAGAGAAAVITSPTGVKHRYAARLSFSLESDRCTNNIAEYEAVIGLRKLRALGVTTCIIRTDSKVVVGQVEKDYAAKDPALMQYLVAIRSLERQFKGFTLQHVDRGRLEKRNRRWGPLAGDGGGAPLRMRERALGAVWRLLAGARARANT
jgi:ribonuclease HI